MLSRGVEIFVGGGRLMVRLLIPVPVPFRGLPLEPADEHDPDVFRLDLTRFGMAPLRVVFSREAGGRAGATHIDLVGQPWTLVRANDAVAERRWLSPALIAVASTGLVVAVLRRRRREGRTSACPSIG
jgi:hypothetical protein